MSAPSPPPPGEPQPVPAPPAPPPRPRRRSRLFSRLILLLLAAAAIVFFLPILVAKSGLRHQLLVIARPGLPDGIIVGEADLGWFAPVVFRRIAIPDFAGRPLCIVGEVRSDRPLWELAGNPDDVGRITLVEPALNIVLTADGSNLQEVLDRLKSTPARRSRPRLRLELQRGQLAVQNTNGQVVFACGGVDAVYDDLRHGTAAATASLAAQTTAPTTSGRLGLQAEWRPPRVDDELVGPGKLDATLTAWPIDLLQPVLNRGLGVTGCAGQVSVGLRTRWDALGRTGGAAELDLLIADLDALLQPADPGAAPVQLRTAEAALRLVGEYDSVGDQLEISESALRSEWATGALSGVVRDLRGVMDCDVTGELQANLDELKAFLPSELRQQLSVEGLETRRVGLRGALRPGASEDASGGSPAPLHMIVDAGWRSLAAYGVASTDAEFRVEYAAQRLVTTPTRVPVSGGRIAGVPDVDLSADSPVLGFAGGKLLERVAFSEAMCRGWMRYLSPLMANATTVDGQFSLAIDKSDVPLSRWPETDLAGEFSIHSARVGPGPLTQQILAIVQQVRGLAERRPGGEASGLAEDLGQWLSIREQTVPFAIRGGRVEHRGLKLFIGPVAVESEGSVGLRDDTLDLLLRVRFPEEWFANRPLLAQFRGDGLQIPIRGTLAQPQIEARPLLEFGRGIGIRATDNLLRRLLDKEQ